MTAICHKQRSVHTLLLYGRALSHFTRTAAQAAREFSRLRTHIMRHATARCHQQPPAARSMGHANCDARTSYACAYQRRRASACTGAIRAPFTGARRATSRKRAPERRAGGARRAARCGAQRRARQISRASRGRGPVASQCRSHRRGAASRGARVIALHSAPWSRTQRGSRRSRGPRGRFGEYAGGYDCFDLAWT